MFWGSLFGWNLKGCCVFSSHTPKASLKKSSPIYVIPCNLHESMKVCSIILVLQSGEVTWNRVPLFPSLLIIFLAQDTRFSCSLFTTFSGTFPSFLWCFHEPPVTMGWKLAPWFIIMHQKNVVEKHARIPNNFWEQNSTYCNGVLRCEYIRFNFVMVALDVVPNCLRKVFSIFFR